MARKKDENKRRTVWFPDELWGQISAAAARDGRTVSGWLRHVAVTGVAVAPDTRKK